MTQYLPPNLLALFEARPPLSYLPPTRELPHLRKNRGFGLLSTHKDKFEDPKDKPVRVKPETRQQRIERKKKEKLESTTYKLEQAIAVWDPHKDSNATTDPTKTLFVARLSYDVTEDRLRREFEEFGRVKKIHMVTDKVTGRPRGYAFVEYEKEKDMLKAYRDAEGKRIRGKRILVDKERGRTSKNWLPRRLGGGRGGRK